MAVILTDLSTPPAATLEMTRWKATLEMTERGLEMKKTGMTMPLTAIKHGYASKGAAVPYYPR